MLFISSKRHRKVLRRCSVAVPKQGMKKSKLNPIFIYINIEVFFGYVDPLFTNCNAATVQRRVEASEK